MLSTTLIARADLTGNSITVTEVVDNQNYTLSTFTVPGSQIGVNGIADFMVNGSSIDL